MAFDACIVAAISKELNELLNGGRIDKILQPDKYTVVLFIRKENNNYKLLIDCSSSYSMAYITEDNFENPPTPFQFCISLRKHLNGYRFTDITQILFDRIIKFSFTGYNDLGFRSFKNLYFETMGKYNNIILTDENNIVLSVLKQVSFSESEVRPILPGIIYTTPKQSNKKSFHNSSEDDIKNLLKNYPEPYNYFLSDSFNGIGKNISDIILSNCGLEECIRRSIFIVDSIKYNEFVPCLLKNKSNTVLCFDLNKISEDFSLIKYPSFSKLIYYYLKDKENNASIVKSGLYLNRQLNNVLNKLNKKLSLLNENLSTSYSKEDYKLKADLLLSNLYNIKKGMRSISVINYYEDNSLIEIELDPLLSPSDNIQKYYKKYSKLKKSESYILEQIEKTETELKYINSVIDHLKRSNGINDIDSIKKELYETGFLSAHKINKNQTLNNKPFRYVSPSGYTVLCGKNNIQNERITFKEASKNDLWFHVKDAPGSHVIIISNNNFIYDKDIEYAANIAAEHSSLRNNNKVEVVYTRVKNIKKIPDSFPGMVRYDTYNSITVNINS